MIGPVRAMRLLLAALLVMSAATPAAAEKGRPTVTLQGEQAEDRAVLEERALPAIRACYAKALKKHASLHGTMNVMIDVDAAGKVTSVLATGFPDDEVTSCARDALGAVDQAPKVNKLSYALVFTPPAEDEVPTGTKVLLRSRGGPGDEGMLDEHAIARVMRGAQAQVQACFKRGLQRDPDLAGKIVVKFAIAANGKVTKASGSGFPDKAVTACVVKIVRGLTFPASKGTSTVTFPFVLAHAQK